MPFKEEEKTADIIIKESRDAAFLYLNCCNVVTLS